MTETKYEFDFDTWPTDFFFYSKCRGCITRMKDLLHDEYEFATHIRPPNDDCEDWRLKACTKCSVDDIKKLIKKFGKIADKNNHLEFDGWEAKINPELMEEITGEKNHVDPDLTN